MSASTGTQISKPAKEQDFENMCVVLWKALLKDPSVQKVGRRGQIQKGVDLFGYRDRKQDQLVGIQCKLKSGNKKLTEKEVLEEFKKALTFEPTPSEYYILTTADDDQKLQAYARKLASEQARNGIHIPFYIWGWGTLCDEAVKYPEALDAFDPNYSAHSKLLLDRQQLQTNITMEISANQHIGFSSVDNKLSLIWEKINQIQPGGATSGVNPVEAHLDREIDGYREMANNGQVIPALTLFENLLNKVGNEASGRILFRIKANIGNCYLKLHRIDEAAEILQVAYEHAPEEPKALANKALGLLLKREWEKVLKLGQENFSSTTVDENFYSHVVQAAIHSPEINAPLELIPQHRRETASVKIAYVAFLRSRNTTPDWHIEAALAFAKFPDEMYLKQFASEAILDEVTKDPSFRRSGILSLEQRRRMSFAAQALTEIWRKTSALEGPFAEDSIGCLTNLITAARTLGDYPTAIKLVKEGIELGVTLPDFFHRAAIVAIESGSKEIDLESMIERSLDHPEKQLLELQYLLARGLWPKLAQFDLERIEDLPSTEQLTFRIAIELSKIITGAKEEIEHGLRDVLDSAPNDLRALVLIASFALKLGKNHLANEAYEKAKRLATDDIHFAARHMISDYAFKRQLWSDFADYLVDHVDFGVDSKELEELATALANERPTRQRALGFFKKLPAELRQMPKYRHSEGFLHYARGDLKAAARCLRDALVDGRADDFLLLISVLKQLGKETEAEEELLKVSLSAIKGMPAYLIAIAQEMVSVGRGEEALSFSYDLVRKHQDDHDAALKYFGLMRRAFDMDAIPIASVVAKDTAFCVENDDGKKQWFVIEGSEDRVTDGVITENHPIATQTIGHTKNHSFELPQGFGRQQTWTIKEVKHKWLWLSHEITENFETWYPGINGISSFKIKDDNLEPVLEQVKKLSETNKTLVEMYAEKHIPLAMVASHFHRDTIGFAEYLRSCGHGIQCCVGQSNERDDALSAIELSKTSGAVLDTYTAWTVSCLGLFPLLKKVFGEIVIPYSVILELKELLGEEEFNDAGAMSIEWRDGEFYRHMRTLEEFEARRNFIQEKIDQIQNYCAVVPVDATASRDGLADKLSSMFSPESLHPAAIAAGGRILISEDLHYRRWAELLWPLKTTWIQPILEVGLHYGNINDIEYATYVGQLAQYQHGFVSLRGQTLLLMAGDGVTDEMDRVSAAAKFIGGPNAQLETHANAIIEFASLASYDQKMPSLHLQKTFGMLLENFVRGRGEHASNMIWYVYHFAPSWSKSYLTHWMRGHFLPVKSIFEQEKAFLDDTAGLAALKIMRNRNY